MPPTPPPPPPPYCRAPRETANALLKELSELDRIHLVLALQRYTAKAKLQHQVPLERE